MARLDKLTVAIFAIAFFLCWVAWMRFFYVAATNPSPARYTELVQQGEKLDPFRQTCTGPAFVDQEDVIWRYCNYEEGADAAWGMTRFDLDKSKARLDWPLPETPDTQIQALARSDSGDLAVAWGSPDVHAIYRLNESGGVETIPLPAAGQIVGFAWNGDALNLLAVSEAGPALHVYGDGAWNDPIPIPRPAICSEAAVCSLQLANQQSDGWWLLYAVLPGVADEGVTLLASDQSGAAGPVGTIPISDLSEGQVVRGDAGTVTGLGTLFDRSPGGALNWGLNGAPYQWQNGQITRLETPALADPQSFYASDYVIQPSGLEWIPGVSFPQRAWQLDDRWLTLRRTEDGMAVSELGGKLRKTLTTDTSFLDRRGTQTELLPAASGGYWVMGQHGMFIKVSDSLERADTMNVFERVVRTFENFGELSVYNDDFYREQRALKMIAFPLVLLSLPAGYLLVFFVRQARKNTRAWINLLVRVSAIYLMLVTIFMWWFWETMNTF